MTVTPIRGRAFHLPADIQQMPEAAARHGRTLLPARTYDEGFPLLWPKCGGEIPIIAFFAQASTVREILAHLGEPTSLPRVTPARGPPLRKWADAGQGECDPQAQPAPDYEFDQRIAR